MKRTFYLLGIFCFFTIFCLLSADCLCHANTGASFLNIAVGARPVAMGGAFSAISNDVNAIHWNPAGISQISQQAFSAMHTSWIADINYDFVGYVYPGKLGTFGGSLVYLSQGTLEGRDENRQKTGEFTASDMAMTMSFAGQSAISGQLMNYGVNLKLIQQQIEVERAFGIAIDVGLLTRLQSYPITFGLSVQNLGPQMKFISEGYNLPLSITAGAGYVVGGLTIALDIKQQIYEGTTNVSIGTEYFLARSFALRVGYLTTVTSNQQSVISESQWDNSNFGTPEGLGAGFGLYILGINTDYSFMPYGDLGNTHRISVSLKF